MSDWLDTGSVGFNAVFFGEGPLIVGSPVISGSLSEVGDILTTDVWTRC